MEIQKKKKNSQAVYMFSLIVAIVGFFFIMIGHPYDNSRLISTGTWCIVFSSLFGFLFIFLEKANRDIKFMLLLLLMVFSTGISMAYSQVFSYANFVAYLCYLEIPFFISYISEVHISNIKKYLYMLFYVLSWFFIYVSKTDIAYQYETRYGKTTVDSLTLGYNNANETGMYLFVTFVVLLSGIFYYKKFWPRFFFTVNAAIIFSLIIKTDSRTCIVVSVCVLASLFILKKLKSISFISNAVNIVPIVWALTVLLFNETLAKITFLGDSVETGRLSIYMRPFYGMDFFTFLIGRFDTFRFSNLHNSYITIFATTGIIGVILFLVFVSQKIIAFNKYFGALDMSEKIAYIGVLMIVVHSSTEAAILISGSAYAVLTVSLYILAFANLFDRGDNNQDITY